MGRISISCHISSAQFQCSNFFLFSVSRSPNFTDIFFRVSSELERARWFSSLEEVRQAFVRYIKLNFSSYPFSKKGNPQTLDMSALRGPGDWYWLPVTSFVTPSLMDVKDIRLLCVLERYLRGRVGEKVVVVM